MSRLLASVLAQQVKVNSNKWEHPSLEELTELYMEQWEPEHSRPHPLLCEHVPVDNGFRRSWCKKCDTDMWFENGIWRSKI